MQRSDPALGHLRGDARGSPRALRVDRLDAAVMLAVVVNTDLVHADASLFDRLYAHEDPSRPRFFAYRSRCYTISAMLALW